MGFLQLQAVGMHLPWRPLCCEAQVLGVGPSVNVAPGPQSAWTPVVVVRGLSWLQGMWNSPGPEIEPVSLHGQVDSHPLDHQGSPF